jgi:hypothetical protein
VRPSRNPGAGARARYELTRDPARSNRIIAAAAGTDATTVQRARRQLEAAGQIPATPHRIKRPPGRRPPLARSAIAVLGPQATPRQVADHAHISVQAAWKALRDVRAAPRTLPPHLARGQCAVAGARLWDSADPADRELAALVCTMECRLLNECLIWAMLNLPPSDTGIWGGFTPAQRQRIARAAQVPPRGKGTRPASAWLAGI